MSAGYNSERGPVLESLTHEWREPVILEETGPRRSQVRLRLWLLVAYLRYLIDARSRGASNRVLLRLQTFLTPTDPDSHWVVPRDEIDEAWASEHDIEFRQRLGGVWTVPVGLSEAAAEFAAAGDETGE